MHQIAIPLLLAPSILYLVSAHWGPDTTCATEITTTVPSGRGKFGSMKSVHEALSHCPNIRSLDLRVTLVGCSGWPDRWNFPFNYDGGETYPDLKILRLEGYDFSNTDDLRAPWERPLQGRSEAEAWTFGLYDWLKRGYLKPWIRAQIYGYPPLPLPKSNLDLWLNAMNWSVLEELAMKDCRPAHEIEKLPPYLRSLRKLSSTNISFVKALPDNILERLTWVGPHRINDLSTILEGQGALLKGLEFRQDEMENPSMQNKFNLSIISELAPNLANLSINLPRNGSWPLESLHMLALSASLQSIEIYSNLQSECQRQKPDMYSIGKYEWVKEHGMDYCTGEDQFQKPLLNETTAEELFRFMRHANTAGNLQNVTFRLGDWTPAWDGPIYSPPWLEHRRVEIECTEYGKEEGEKHCRMLQSYGYWPPDADNENGLNWLFQDI